MLINVQLMQQLLKGYTIFAPSKKNSTILEVVYKN